MESTEIPEAPNAQIAMSYSLKSVRDSSVRELRDVVVFLHKRRLKAVSIYAFRELKSERGIVIGRREEGCVKGEC